MEIIITLARPVKAGALIKGGSGRKSDRIIELSRAHDLVRKGRIEAVGKTVEVETSAGRMTVPIFRDAKAKSIGLRGLSARMSGPDYVDLLDQVVSEGGDSKSRAASVLESWKKG